MPFCLCVKDSSVLRIVCFFFFNDTATTEIYTLSLHDALPISQHRRGLHASRLHKRRERAKPRATIAVILRDRKSTRLNSSHLVISYAVFCLKKKRRRQGRRCQACRNHLCRFRAPYRRWPWLPQ